MIRITMTDPTGIPSISLAPHLDLYSIDFPIGGARLTLQKSNSRVGNNIVVFSRALGVRGLIGQNDGATVSRCGCIILCSKSYS